MGAIATNNMLLSQSDVVLILREKLLRVATQKILAENLGISEQYLGDVLRFRRSPGKKLLKSIGLKKIVVYTKREDEK